MKVSCTEQGWGGGGGGGGGLPYEKFGDARREFLF